jgi:hypothetical protein
MGGAARGGREAASGPARRSALTLEFLAYFKYCTAIQRSIKQTQIFVHSRLSFRLGINTTGRITSRTIKAWSGIYSVSSLEEFPQDGTHPHDSTWPYALANQIPLALHKLSVGLCLDNLKEAATSLVGEEVKTWRHGEFRGTAVSNPRLLVEHKGAI